MRKRKREAWAKWRGLIAEHRRAGRSVAALCRQRGISSSHFFAWKKQLRQAGAERFVGDERYVNRIV